MDGVFWLVIPVRALMFHCGLFHFPPCSSLTPSNVAPTFAPSHVIARLRKYQNTASRGNLMLLYLTNSSDMVIRSGFALELGRGVFFPALKSWEHIDIWLCVLHLPTESFHSHPRRPSGVYSIYLWIFKYIAALFPIWMTTCYSRKPPPLPTY
jgi:hypothetical protein